MVLMVRLRQGFLYAPKKVGRVGGHWFLARGTDEEGLLRVLFGLETCSKITNGLLDELKVSKFVENYRL